MLPEDEARPRSGLKLPPTETSRPRSCRGIVCTFCRPKRDPGANDGHTAAICAS
ncbi:hypothetical protein [Lysobacter gummosus]|uniref:hypothetical protein n=1 Tax=Lysobacter gummosus TaxID=262324 RepID=UPI00363572BF